MMKTMLLGFFALVISIPAIRADSALSSRLAVTPILSSVPSLALADGSRATPTGSRLSSSSSNFAQLGTPSATVLPSGFGLAFIAILVLGLRITGLNRARALADHERDSYRGKARMFRTLHEGGADH